MKVVCLADLHLRLGRPEMRIDSYYLTQYQKLEFCLHWAIEHDAIVVISGDVFDSAKASNMLLQTYVGLLATYKDELPIYCVYGQHDMRYHSTDTKDTPLRVLYEADVITILNALPRIDKKDKKERPVLYGAGWGEDIPSISEDDIKILVTHRMVINDKPLWDGQTGYSEGKKLLEENDFDLIVSGDNHQSFVIKHEDKTLVNPGSLMRMTIAQKDYKPHLHVYDTITREVERIPIPIEPPAKVFDIEKAEVKKERSEELEAFVESLSEETLVCGLDFKDNLAKEVRENKVTGVEKQIIDEVMEGIEDA